MLITKLEMANAPTLSFLRPFPNFIFLFSSLQNYEKKLPTISVLPSTLPLRSFQPPAKGVRRANAGGEHRYGAWITKI